MSHRITPQEAEGQPAPTFWERAADSFRAVDEGLESQIEHPVRLHELTDGQFRRQEMADFEFAGPLIF
jgi:hypothetical protein